MGERRINPLFNVQEIQKVGYILNPYRFNSVPDLGFEPYVAPADFDRTAQPVDIYEVFNAYYKTNDSAKWIYAIADTATTWTFNLGTSYRYGYTSGGVDYVVDLNTITQLSQAYSGATTSINVDDTSAFPASGTLWIGNLSSNYIFVYTSKTATSFIGASQTIDQSDNSVVYLNTYSITWSGTNRWAIINNATTSNVIAYGDKIGIVWMYCGKLVNRVDGSITGSNNTTLKYVHVDNLDNITSLGEDFYRCTALLGTIYIPDYVTVIPGYIFGNCTSVTGLVIGNSVQTIGASAFQACSNIVGTLTIPNTVTSIGESSFSSCTKISGLSFETTSTLVTIGSNAFNACTGITGTWSVPTTVTTINARAFYNCTGYSGTLAIPSGITSLGEGVFGGCNFNALDVSANSGYHAHDGVLYQESNHYAIHGIKGYSGTLTIESDTVKIGDHCFMNNSSRNGSLTFPSSVTTIGVYSFYFCSSFTSLTIPNTITTLNNNCFQRLSGLTSFSWASDSPITIIPYECFSFSFTTSVGTVTIPNQVITLSMHSFDHCGMTGIVIGSSVTTIGSECFWGCSNLTGNFNVPASVATISYDQTYFFQGTNFTSITSSSTNYPASDNVLYDVKTAGQVKAWWSAKGYSGTLTLRSDTTHILANCFNGHTGRSGAISIPNTVISIATNAFYGCTGFNGVMNIGESITSTNIALGTGSLYCANVTLVNSYRSTAPAITGTPFPNFAKALHTPTGGGTGYGVAPWTTAAIFSSITADL